MDQKYAFFKEVETPLFWTFADVVYWIAAGIIPHAEFGDTDYSERDSFSTLSEFFLDFGRYSMPFALSPDTTARLGLPLDPWWKEMLREDDSLNSPLPSDTIESNRELIDRQIEIEQWERTLADFLDQYQAEVVLDLRRGHLHAEGIAVPGLVDQSMHPDHPMQAGIRESFQKTVPDEAAYADGFERVPKEFFTRARASFYGNYVQARDKVYFGLRIKQADVLKQYPPKSLASKTIHSCGEGFFTSHGQNTRYSKSNRGRPQKRWDQVAVRIAEVLVERGSIPAKQDAFAQELVNWYYSEFGEDLGLTTIKGRLKPYYNNTNIQKSEK